MKRFLAALIIVALFSGVVFYMGWTQFKIEPDHCGVLITKTNGIDPIPVENGKFYWRWQVLLPTNATVKQFKIKPHFSNQVISGTLPSAEVYGSTLGQLDAFNYQFNFNITVFTTPELIIELIKDSKIDSDDDLQNYLDDTCKTIAQRAASYIMEKCRSSTSFRPETLRMADLFKYISFGDDYPFVEVEHFSINYSKVPDFDLYEKTRKSMIQGQAVSLPEPAKTNNIDTTDYDPYNYEAEF